ncbi:MAG: hypothetical protein K5756_07155 [Clostridiales bacterium]|nr:hypothetical protein [Clostridiales bacterium]
MAESKTIIVKEDSIKSAATELYNLCESWTSFPLKTINSVNGMEKSKGKTKKALCDYAVAIRNARNALDKLLDHTRKYFLTINATFEQADKDAAQMVKHS